MKNPIKSIGYLLLAGSISLLVACGDADNDGVADNVDTTATNMQTMADTTLNSPADMNESDDAEFVSEAVGANLAEIAMHKAAETHATTADVKAHAKHMLTDHNKMLSDMQAYASRKGYSIPADASADKKEELDKMNTEKKGADWDKAYLDKMVDDHKKDISKFEDAEDDVKDAELKTMISSTLPTLRSHLQMVEDAKKKMK